jgi:tetratricopeptide (TPR) repeat protein
VDLLRTRALAEAGRWAALAAALGYSTGAFAFHPPALSAERAQGLRDEIDQALADGHLPEALYMVRRLLRSYPEDSSTIRREAEIFERLGDSKSESAAYELAMRLSATPTENCPAIGRSYAKQNLPEKALDADRRCLAVAPNNVDMRLYYALRLERTDHDAEARKEFEGVLELSPGYTDAAVGLARLDLAAGHPQDAFNRLHPLNQADPGADALAAEARAEVQLGHKERAKDLLHQALKLSPNYTDLRNQLDALEGK